MRASGHGQLFCNLIGFVLLWRLICVPAVSASKTHDRDRTICILQKRHTLRIREGRLAWHSLNSATTASILQRRHFKTLATTQSTASILQRLESALLGLLHSLSTSTYMRLMWHSVLTYPTNDGHAWLDVDKGTHVCTPINVIRHVPAGTCPGMSLSQILRPSLPFCKISCWLILSQGICIHMCFRTSCKVNLLLFNWLRTPHVALGPIDQIDQLLAAQL